VLGPIFRRALRRWKSTIVLAFGVLLCAIATILVDARMYLSAGFFGFLGVAGLVWFVVPLLRAHRENRERERQRLASGERRVAAAQARSEKIDKAKATVADAARIATRSAARVADVAKAVVAGAYQRVRFRRGKKERNRTSRPN